MLKYLYREKHIVSVAFSYKPRNFICNLAALMLSMCLPLLAQTLPYPRIVNLYGAGLAWKSIDAGLPYWKKLGMIVGGGSDWHYDYDSTTTVAAHERARASAAILRKANPKIVIIPYFDVIEGPHNPALPKNFWLYDTSGAKISTWPGYYRVDTKNPLVLDMTKAAVLKQAFTEKVWDGSFLDCWEPDSYLVPSLRAAGPEKSNRHQYRSLTPRCIASCKWSYE
jgi:hypothetical protein